MADSLPPDPLPKGLVFFARPASTRQRRRRRLFLGILALAVLALIWPGSTLAAGIYPMIFGLPLSLAWVIVWLFVMLGAQIWLYRADIRNDAP
jgi:hypothetical protein